MPPGNQALPLRKTPLVADPIPTLVCTCGNVMKAPGAKPGRVGKCPKCGALIRVQGETTTPEPHKPSASPTLPSRPKKQPTSSDADPHSNHRRSTPILPTSGGYGIASETIPESGFRRSADETRLGVEARPIRPPDVGPVKSPIKLETKFSQSLSYPLWSWSSIGLLCFLPPILVFTTSPLTFLVRTFLGNSPFVLPSYVSMIPVFFFMTGAVGYGCIYLGNILITTAGGEILPPRPPTFDDEVFRVLGRWFWALVSGVLIGGLPAFAYWVYCGEIDWIDRLMFFNLTMLGIAYAQLALLAALLHDDPLAANPFTVLKAMVRLGLSYIGVCSFTLTALCVVGVALALVSMVKSSFIHLVIYWIFWVFALFTAMIVFRRLGLYCHKQKLIQTWFADRPRWGV